MILINFLAFIYKVTIDNINVKVTKSFGEEHSEINYDITAHTNGYLNFIPSSSLIGEVEGIKLI